MTQTIVSRNPATGETLQTFNATAISELPALFDRARAAQEKWAARRLKERCAFLLDLRETLLNHRQEIIQILTLENGKPAIEALSSEVLPIVGLLSYFARKAPALLKKRKIPMATMWHRSSELEFWPLGTIAVISPWNYPFHLPMGDIAMALVAGNAVIFKPSEVTPWIGAKIQELCELAGLPPGLLQTIQGDGQLGAALVKSKPDKVFFTGSAATGKKIMSMAGEQLTPVNLELGGKDPMIILPDADLDYASSAALWGSFSNAGQACASTERLIVHESIAPAFLELLQRKISQLRLQGPDSDLGTITLEKQKDIYERQLKEAREQGAEILTGGSFAPGRTRLEPTLVAGPGVESLQVYREETFGPVVAVTTFRTLDEAIKKANDSAYGLLASVMTRDLALGERVARQIQAGTVIINEVLYTSALAETPWGGIKESGIGRTHSDLGMMEFVNVRHIHKPKSRLFVFKSWWWFPYSRHQYELFQQVAELFRRSWVDRIKAVPLVLWNLVKMLKDEKRI